MNDSGKFQEMEWNYSWDCLTFPVNLQRTPSSRSMLGRDKRLPLDNMEYIRIHRKTFLVINFLRLIHPEIILKEFTHAPHKLEQGSVPQATGTGTRDYKQSRDTIPMPIFARRPSTVSSAIPVGFPQNSMVGQQRQQISDLQFDKFHNPQSFVMWKIRFKNQVTTCSDVLSDAMSWVKEVEMVDSLEELKSSRSVCGKNFQILRCRTRRLLLLRTRSSRIPNSRRRWVSGKDGSERGSDSSRKTDRLHDSRLFSSHWCSWCRSWLCGFILYHSSQWHCYFDSKWDEILLSMTQIPSDDILESLYKLRITRVWSTQNCIGIVRHGNSSDKHWTWLSQIEGNGEEKYRAEFENNEFWDQKRKFWNKRRGQES